MFRLAAALKKLHEAAGSPPPSVLRRQASAQEPAVEWPSSTVNDWLRGESAPSEKSAAAFKKLVEYLEARASRSSIDYAPLALGHWDRLIKEAQRYRQARRGGRPARKERDDAQWEADQGDHQRAATGQEAAGNHAYMNNHVTVQFHVEGRGPVIVGRPPQPLGSFIERPGLVNWSSSPERDTPGQRLVLVGDGGVGKTELAAVQFQKSMGSGAGLGLWIIASSRQAVLSSYWQAARELGLEAADADEGAERLLSWLAGTRQSWIVVLDDVADPVDLHHLWPQGSAGRVLVTTRRTDAAWREVATPIEISVFAPVESARYLEMKLKSLQRRFPDILSEAPQLAADLGYLPLALSHASAFIADEGITCAEYRGLLHDRLMTLADVMPTAPAAAGSGYPTAVPAAWSLALDRADALEPRGLARPLLWVISCLEASGIAEAALSAKSTRQYLAAFAADQGEDTDKPVSNNKVKGALKALNRLSLIYRLPGKAVRTHPLAQRATRESCTAEELADAARAAVAALAETWPGDGTDAAAVEMALSATDAVRVACPEAVWEPEAHAILFHRGYLTGRSGLAVGAAAYFTQLAEESAERLGAGHSDTRLARRQQALWLGESGQSAEAAACYRQLLNEHEDEDADSALGHLEQRFWLAHYTGASGNYADAVRQLDDLIPEIERMAEAGPAVVLEARRDRARWIGAGGETSRAVQLLEDILEETRLVIGPDAAGILTTRAVIADTRERAGDSVRALSEWEKLVPDYERGLGRTHPETLAARHRLARLRAEVMGWPAAAEAMRHLLNDALPVMGTEDPRLLGLREDIARAAGRAQDPQEAIAILEEVIRELIRTGHEDDREALRVRANLAGWHGRSGRPDLAITGYEQVLSDQLRVGADDSDTLFTRYQIIHWRLAVDSSEQLHTALNDLIHDARYVTDDKYNVEVRAQAQLLFLRHNAGEDIEKELEALLAIASDASNDDELTLTLHANLLTVRIKKSDREAGAQLRRLLPVLASRLGNAHSLTRQVRKNLSR